MLEAVAPATKRLESLAATVWPRIASTRSSVAELSGPLFGVTPITAIDLSGSNDGAPTLATSFNFVSSPATLSAAAGAPPPASGDHGQGAVRARAEAVGDQVVGLAFGLVL